MINRLVAIVLLLVTLLPMAALFYTYATMTTAPFSDNNFAAFQSFIIPYAVSVFILILGYVAYIAKTNRVPKDKKMLWVIAIVTFHVFAMLVFWFNYIWRQPYSHSDTFQTE